VSALFTVREARPDDVASIVPWTMDTFDWGDYVPDRIRTWLGDQDSVVIVCADGDDRPVAVSHAVMLSPDEAWLEAARVHPAHRRSGMGSAMNRAGVDWARERGAKVVRLATEATNVAARRQVAALGYRVTSSWVYAELPVDPGHRALDGHRLRPASVADVGPAWMTWSQSELALAGRDLIAIGWQWRRMTPDDLHRAASSGTFYQSPAGWLVVDQPDAEWMRVIWMTVAPSDALVVFDGLLEMERERNVETVTVMLPKLPWTSEVLSRTGGHPKEELVHSLAL
jgi:ribosomal protein S18 acetylase RimI-like enzyme